MNIFVLVSYVVAIIATLVLSLYFLREYFLKRLRASFAWGIGFLVYGIAQIFDLYVDVFGEISMGKIGLLVGLTITALGMVLFYYGTSLLFFSPKSFFREKVTAFLAVFYILFSIYLTTTYEVENFKEAVRPAVSLVVMMVISLIIGILFFNVSRRLKPDDPRKTTVLLVAAGWFLIALHGPLYGLLLEYSLVLDASIHIMHAVGWVLILYGMTVGRAART